jgi:hypothetical protein
VVCTGVVCAGVVCTGVVCTGVWVCVVCDGVVCVDAPADDAAAARAERAAVVWRTDDPRRDLVRAVEGVSAGWALRGCCVRLASV